jgi:hypothetical protein
VSNPSRTCAIHTPRRRHDVGLFDAVEVGRFGVDERSIQSVHHAHEATCSVFDTMEDDAVLKRSAHRPTEIRLPGGAERRHEAVDFAIRRDDDRVLPILQQCPCVSRPKPYG